MRWLVLRVALLLMLIMLVACGSEPTLPTQTPAPTPIPDTVSVPDDLPDYGLIAGGHRMEVLGAVSASDKATGREQIEYGPALAGMQSVGTNTAGNLAIAMTTPVASGGEGRLLLEFPDTVGIGTHQVGTNSELNPAPVGAIFFASGRAPFSGDVSGTLTLDFINRRSINGQFDITLRDADGQAVTVRGAFHRIPFTPHEEYTIEMSGIYSTLDFEPQFSKGIQGADGFITLRFQARRAFAEAEYGTLTLAVRNYETLTAGEYAVNAADSPVAVEVRLGDVVLPVESGTTLFIRTTDIRNGVQESVWQGAVNLSLLTAAGDTTLSAIFNHFDID